MSATYPNLKGVATKNLVEKVDAGKYKADYINWSRTMQLLRDHAPGWLPEMVQTAEGGYVHRGGVGGYLLIRFVNVDGTFTPGFPQAIMDNRNQAIPVDAITARDITDTHRRGVCMAAALAFGLAYELWAKMPLESGYVAPPAGNGQPAAAEPSPEPPPAEPLPPAANARKASKALVKKITDLIPDLAALRDVDEPSVRLAIETDAGPLDDLTADAAKALLEKMERWKGNLATASAQRAQQAQASAGEAAAGNGSPEPTEAGDGAPAEQSQFQIPEGARAPEGTIPGVAA